MNKDIRDWLKETDTGFKTELGNPDWTTENQVGETK